MSGLFLAAWRLVLKRAASDGLIVGAAFVTVLLAASLLAAGPIYSDAVALSGLERTLADAPTRDSGLELSGRVPLDEYQAARRRAERGIERVFGPGGAAVYRSGASDSFSLPDKAGIPADALTVFSFYEGLERHATLVAGSWPEPTSGEEISAVLPAEAARDLGLAPGDELRVAATSDPGRTVDVRVSGTYRPDDPGEAFWWGSPLETEGRQEISYTTFGPLVVPEEDFGAVAGGEAQVRWRAALLPEKLTVADLPGLRERLDELEESVNTDEGAELSADTGLPAVLERTDHLLTVTRSGVLIPSVQLAILAGAALLFLAGLLAERRALEAAIMRSRGAGAEGVAGLALMEGALLAVPAALAAPWVAAFGLRALNHVGPLAQIGLRLEPRVGLASYALAVLAAVLCVGALAFPALRSGAIASTAASRGRPRPKTFFQRAGLDLVLVAVALLAYWQLRRYGGPVLERVQGRLGIDPLLIAAPALGLLAGAVLALRVVPAAAALVERVAASAKGMVATLGTRELARRPHRYARSALLLTLALAIGLFATAYSHTWLVSQRDQADFTSAADVRVTPSERTGSIPKLDLTRAYEGIDGVRSAYPVLSQPFELSQGGGQTSILALDAARAPEAIHFRSDLADQPLGQLLGPLAAQRTKLAAVPLPGRPVRIAIDMRVRAPNIIVQGHPVSALRFVGTPTLFAVIEDADGLLHRLPVGDVTPRRGPRRIVVDLTEAATERERGEPAYPLKLVSFELEARPGFRRAVTATLTVPQVATSETANGGFTRLGAPAQPWKAAVREPENLDKPPGVLGISSERAFFALEFATGSFTDFFARGPVTFTATPGRNRPPRTVPAVATDRFAEVTGSGNGALIPLSAGGRGASLAITNVVRGFPTLPQETGAAIVDLPTLEAAAYLQDGTIFTPTEWWIDTVPGRSTDVGRRLEASPFSSPQVIDRIDRARALSTDPVALGISGALYIGFAAAAIFAVIGFAVSSAISTAERSTEFAVLRSVGLSRRQLSGALALEGGLTACLALAAGTALGVLLAWFVLPYVSLSGEGGRPFPGVLVHFPWETAALLEGSLLLALAVVVAVEIRVLGRVRLAPALRAGEDR
ncbi:MAG TPA: ABC transporter permease [Gaiellaceae bacterium]|nr:ABC transporter permease [Gaiellaceae bacterium]